MILYWTCKIYLWKSFWRTFICEDFTAKIVNFDCLLSHSRFTVRQATINVQSHKIPYACELKFLWYCIGNNLLLYYYSFQISVTFSDHVQCFLKYQVNNERIRWASRSESNSSLDPGKNCITLVIFWLLIKNLSIKQVLLAVHKNDGSGINFLCKIFKK